MAIDKNVDTIITKLKLDWYGYVRQKLQQLPQVYNYMYENYLQM